MFLVKHRLNKESLVISSEVTTKTIQVTNDRLTTRMSWTSGKRMVGTIMQVWINKLVKENVAESYWKPSHVLRARFEFSSLLTCPWKKQSCVLLKKKYSIVDMTAQGKEEYLAFITKQVWDCVEVSKYIFLLVEVQSFFWHIET